VIKELVGSQKLPEKKSQWGPLFICPYERRKCLG